MALLIAEGGSSKVDWALIDKKGSEITSFTTSGMNPFYHTDNQLTHILKEQLLPELTDLTTGIDSVIYYGAGCIGTNNRNRMSSALREVMGEDKYIEVYDDLLGAARATLGIQPGIVCILGTGQNSGTFDGRQIVDQIPPLGFALGDEGSGASIGRKVIQAYFYRELPEDLKLKFENEFEPKREDILMKVYGSSYGNRYIAGFARFAKHYSNHPFIGELLHKEFSEMIQRHLMKYETVHRSNVALTGSIGYNFRKNIRTVFDKHDIKLGEVLEKPVNGLVKFHG